MAKRNKGAKPEYQLRIAKERIKILFNEAEQAEPELAKRYMKLAKKIGMRYNVRLGTLKRRFCRHCFSFFAAGNSRRRMKSGIMNVTCLGCGRITRYPYKEKSSIMREDAF